MKGRRSIRLQGYDYSQHGCYFVTVCTYQMRCLFGKVVDEQMRLNEAGNLISKWWNKLYDKFDNIIIDEYVVMPNHFHGIIQIVGVDPCVYPSSEGTHMGEPLHKIIQWFKTMTTNEYIQGVKNKKFSPFNHRFWHRNYYEHIIRNPESLYEIRQYICQNPLKWELGKFHPKNFNF